MFGTCRENRRGASVEVNHAGRDAGKEAQRKTTNQIERCAPKRPGGEWIEPRGICRGGSGS